MQNYQLAPALLRLKSRLLKARGKEPLPLAYHAAKEEKSDTSLLKRFQGFGKRLEGRPLTRYDTWSSSKLSTKTFRSKSCCRNSQLYSRTQSYSTSRSSASAPTCHVAKKGNENPDVEIETAPLLIHGRSPVLKKRSRQGRSFKPED